LCWFSILKERDNVVVGLRSIKKFMIGVVDNNGEDVGEGLTTWWNDNKRVWETKRKRKVTPNKLVFIVK
jgi:hypothetical protein